MPQYCCVPGCTKATSGHSFPTETRLQLQWRVAIRRQGNRGKLWTPNMDRDRVCAAHFLPDDYLKTPGSSVKRQYRKLKTGAVPSVFSFSEKVQHRQSTKRIYKRREMSESELRGDDEADISVIGGEVTIQLSEDSGSRHVRTDSRMQDSGKKALVNTGTQAGHSLIGMTPKFSITNFKTDARAIHYYTGLENYNHVRFLCRMLGQSDVSKISQNFRCLDFEDQIFLTLMKLRNNKDFEEMSILYGISIETVSNIFQTWIMFMYSRMKQWLIWPSRKAISDHMPKEFKKLYPKTRVILDATEIPIGKPTDVDLQSQTFSNYKNRNTVKVMIGISPHGAVSFISDCYPGSASDRQIIEDCDLYMNAACRFEKGDSIMADRGIMVQDLFAPYDVCVNTPTPLRGKSQLEPSEVLRDRRVSSKRIHVERVIGLAKTYKILKHGIPSRLLRLCSQIVYVTFSLVNLRKCIVDDDA